MQCWSAPQNQEYCIYELKWTWALCIHLRKDFFLGCLTEDQRIIILQQVRNYLPRATASHYKRLETSSSLQMTKWSLMNYKQHFTSADRHIQCHFKPPMKHYTYLFAISVLKVGGRLLTPRLITAKPMLLLGLVPTPISVRPILQNTIMNM